MKEWLLIPAILAFLGLLTLLTIRSEAKPHELLQVLLGTLNLLALWWLLTKLGRHSKETEKVLKAVTMQTDELLHQVRLSIMPSLVAKIDKTERINAEELLLFLWNAGNGSALKVQIDPFRPGIYGIQDSRYEIHFDCIPCIQPGPTPHEVVHKYVLPDYTDDPMYVIKGWAGIQEIQHLNKERPLRITFQDIEGNEYEQVLRVDYNDCEPEPVRLIKKINDQSSIAAQERAREQSELVFSEAEKARAEEQAAVNS
jgi:hypothetical protein